MVRGLLSIIFCAALFQCPAGAGWDYPLDFQGREIIEGDLENLCRLNFGARLDGQQEMENILEEMLGIEKVGCAGIKGFFQDRVRLLIRDFSSKNIVLADGFGVERKYERDTRIDESIAISTMMLRLAARGAYAAHVGSMIYIDLHNPRIRNYLVRHSTLEASSIEFYFDYTSVDGERKTLPLSESVPRIISVSDGFFMRDEYPNQQDIQAAANSVYRVSALIHESFHNEDEANHVVCRDLRFEGKKRCNETIYGPYGVENVFILYAANICDDCSAEERGILISEGRRRLIQRINSPSMKGRVMDLAVRMENDAESRSAQ